MDPVPNPAPAPAPAPAPVPAPAPGGDTRTVAYENFQAVVQAKTGLEQQVAQLKSQIQTLTEKAATVDTLGAELNTWKAKASEAEGKFATYTELSGVLGTTDAEVVGLFDQKYRALPEKDRPDRKAWIEGIRAKPDEAPALLRPWLTPSTPAQPGAPKPTPPKVPGTPATPPGAPSSVSPEQVARVREECAKSGDWTKWKELSKSMGLRQ